MSFGISRSLLADLRCPDDAAELLVESDAAESEDVVDGELVCTRCAGRFPITGGIVRFLDDGALDEESAFEKEIRNEHAIADGFELDRQYGPVSRAELDPTIEALDLQPAHRLLELGCGNGRYTQRVSGMCEQVLAVDFSDEALVRLRHRLGQGGNVGLVQADITRFRVAPGSFDRALSTLVSNLPSRAHRDAMYRLAADALTPEGRFVFGTHLQGIRERLTGVPKDGRYPETKIYRYNFTLAECRSEPSTCFGRVTARPIQVFVPLLRRLPRPGLYRQSRILEHVPVLRGFGALSVCVASQPRSGSEG